MPYSQAVSLPRVTEQYGKRYVKETLIYSEFPRHMDVPPFSAACQLLKMKKKVKSPNKIFFGTFFVL